MVGDRVPIEDRLELRRNRHVQNPSLDRTTGLLFDCQTIITFQLLSITLLRVDLLVVKLTQLVFPRLVTFVFQYVLRGERGNILIFNAHHFFGLLLSQLLLQPALFGLLQ